MVISASNVVYTRKQIKSLFFKNRSLSVSLPVKDKLDKSAIKRGFMPNFIHSMDASHIHIIVDKLIEKNLCIPFFTIHDCFATTPNNMEVLNKIVKESFIQLYFNQNYLKKMHFTIMEQIRSFENIVIFEKFDAKLGRSVLKFQIGDSDGEYILPVLPSEFN